MAELAKQVLALPGIRPEVAPLIILTAMVGTMASNPGPAALEIWRANVHRMPPRQSKQLVTRLVVAQALQQAQSAPRGAPASSR